MGNKADLDRIAAYKEVIRLLQKAVEQCEAALALEYEKVEPEQDNPMPLAVR